MRLQTEIIDRIKENSGNFFDFTPEVLVPFLHFNNAKEFLKEDATEASYKEWALEPTRENVIKEMKDYMPFAIGKAENERGLSASRSLQKFSLWLWLLDDKEMIETCDEATGYGLDALHAICDKYGFEKKSD